MKRSKLPTVFDFFLKYKKRIKHVQSNEWLRKGKGRVPTKVQKWLIRLVWRRIWTIHDNAQHLCSYQQIPLSDNHFITLNYCDIRVRNDIFDRSHRPSTMTTIIGVPSRILSNIFQLLKLKIFTNAFFYHRYFANISVKDE